MRTPTTSRIASTVAGMMLCVVVSAFAQAPHKPAPKPLAASPAAQQSSAPASATVHPHSSVSKNPELSAKPTGEHLADWISRHGNLTPEQQQKALQSEPGFRELPPATQQRMRDRLTQLNSMPPAQRQRLLERNEAMEHLTPQQRGQVRDAMKQLADLPEDQRRYVARTFRGLRELSPAQRQTVLNSERFNHLTDAQRASLNSLMKVEPLLPPPYDAAASNTAASNASAPH